MDGFPQFIISLFTTPLYAAYKKLPDYFNLTLSYRRDSDLVYLYDGFKPIENHSDSNQVWLEKEVLDNVNAKSMPILATISNCNTPSKRELYLKELDKYINITKIGRCYNNSCKRGDKCEDELIKKHFFILAFENSVCNDYITEKFWRLKKLIVPIVLNRNIIRDPELQNYFIAASDFSHPSKLAEYLNYLMKNRIEYMKYMNWAKKYRKIQESFEIDALCKLCEMTTKKVRQAIPNIVDWWEIKSNCSSNYANKLLER
uniref:Fucosyltransferase n=1 Tax=Acrobeloides nanus TaxID=290746 RepID=A0A914CUZ2_9BILA